MYVRMYVCTYVCMYVCVYIYIYVHMHILHIEAAGMFLAIIVIIIDGMTASCRVRPRDFVVAILNTGG